MFTADKGWLTERNRVWNRDKVYTTRHNLLGISSITELNLGGIERRFGQRSARNDEFDRQMH